MKLCGFYLWTKSYLLDFEQFESVKKIRKLYPIHFKKHAHWESDPAASGLESSAAWDIYIGTIKLKALVFAYPVSSRSSWAESQAQ